MGKTIDIETHADIVELIEAEMESLMETELGNAEGLASLILGRLGYERPKKSCLPWVSSNLAIGNKDGTLYIYDRNKCVGLGSYVSVAKIPNDMPVAIRGAYAKLFVAAPKLAEALWDAILAYDDPADVIHIDVHIDKFREVLREAGADI